MIRSLLVLIAFSTSAFAQSKAIDAYLAGRNVEQLANQPPGTRDINELRDLLPDRRSNQLVEYLDAKTGTAEFGGLLNSIDAARLNKLVGAAPGGSGTTSLTSKVAVPAVLGFAVEYGSILQVNNGAASTLRGNLLGLARFALGSEQFPYCPEIDQKTCNSSSRWLRRFSASLSFEDTRSKTGTALVERPQRTQADLFGNDFRMASWGARFDFTQNNLDDPKYVAAWREQIVQLRGADAAQKLTTAVRDLFSRAVETDAYGNWMAETLSTLQNAKGVGEFKRRLEERLDVLVPILSIADPNFASNVSALRRAYSNYFAVRDALVREAQRHKLSLEYANLHPQNEPSRSTVRLIYSNQPTDNAAVVTLNFASTLYNKGSSLRDVQLGGQLDRGLGEISGFGQAVLTFAGYYQWMRENALIELPGTTAPVLETKGHIGVLQGKVSIPMGDTMKVPISITLANRTELIKERDVRGQIGLTLDFDKLFR
jgi:hypothetical protein